MSVKETAVTSREHHMVSEAAYWMVVWGLYMASFSFGRLFLFSEGHDGFKLPIIYELQPFLGEFFYAFLLIIVFFLPLNLLLSMLVSRSKSSSCIIVVRFLLTVGFVALVVSSSILFKLSGSFIGIEAIRMFLNDTVQLFQHAIHFYSLKWTILIILAVLVFSYGIMKIVLTIVNRFRGKTILTSALVAFVLVLFGFNGVRLAAGFSSYMIVGEFGQTYELADFLNEKQLKTGPFSFMAEDIIFQILPTYTSVDLAAFRIRKNHQISMQEYLKNKQALSSKYDVIVLLIESLRPDQLRTFGGKRDVMPNLDKVAEQAVRFHRAYAQSSHSNYADVVPLSSHYPLRSRRTHIYPENPKYPRVLLHDILKPLGYRTAIISSQNENWGGMLNYLDTGNLDYIFHAAQMDGKLKNIADEEVGNKDVANWMMEGKKSGKIDDSITVSEAVRWIGSLEDSQPYSLYMNLQTSHFPYDIPDGFTHRFLNADKKTERKFKSGDFKGMRMSDIKDAYSDSLFYIDYQIGRLVDFLKNTGRWDRTLLVVSADTSTFFYGGFLGNGGWLYDEVVHVPLLIKAPGLEPGDDIRLVQHVDVLPTITGLLGLGQHPSFQGIDLFDESAYSKNRAVYMVAQSPISYQYGMMKDGWKIIYDRRSRKYLLYREPYLEKNVLSGNIEIGESMAQQLQAWVALQIGYYSSRDEMKEYYPPVIVD